MKIIQREILKNGLRPGEKVFEILLIEANTLPSQHSKKFKIQDKFIPLNQLTSEIDYLEDCIDKNDLADKIPILKKL